MNICIHCKINSRLQQEIKSVFLFYLFCRLCTYVCKYVSGDREYPEAYGKNKKDAKEAAATRVYEEITKTQNAEVTQHLSTYTVYHSVIYEFCLKFYFTFKVSRNREQKSEVASLR